MLKSQKPRKPKQKMVLPTKELIEQENTLNLSDPTESLSSYYLIKLEMIDFIGIEDFNYIFNSRLGCLVNNLKAKII